MASMLAMPGLVGEWRRKMNHKVKPIPMTVFMRGETTIASASMAAGKRKTQACAVIEEHLKPRREHPEVVESCALMAARKRRRQEVIDQYLKRRREHPEIYNVAEGRMSKTELGDSTFATWVGVSRSQMPSIDSMRKLLDGRNLCSTGKRDVVQRRFKRNVRRDSVSVSDPRCQISKASPKVKVDNRIILEGDKSLSVGDEEGMGATLEDASLSVKAKEGMGVTLEEENRHSVMQPVDHDDFGSDPGDWDEQASATLAQGKTAISKAFYDDMYFTRIFRPQSNSGGVTARYMRTLNRNVLSWGGKSMNALATPCHTCMCVLLNQFKITSIGSPANVRLRFARTFRQDQVTFSNQQWHARKCTGLHEKTSECRSDCRLASTSCEECNQSFELANLEGKQSVALVHRNNHNFASWQKSVTDKVSVASPCDACMRQLLYQCGLPSMGSPANVKVTFRRSFGRDNVPFFNQQWHVRKCTGLHEMTSDCRLASETSLASTYCGECKPSIHLVYQHLFPRFKQETAANGSSSYAEITRGGVSKIIKVISDLFKQSGPQEEASRFRALDLGGGFMTCLAHIAQVIPGEYASVEYCNQRAWAFATGYGSLLDRYSASLCNTKMAYALMNIEQLDWYDCDVVYTFDEAFPQQLWGKIVRTFVASPRCKLLITFKPAKATIDYIRWQQYMKDLGLIEACPRLHLFKKGSENSNAMFMIRSENHNYNPSDTDWAEGEKFHGDLAMAHKASLRAQQCKPNPTNTFWEQSKNFWGDTMIARKAVADLEAQAATVASDAKRNRR